MRFGLQMTIGLVLLGSFPAQTGLCMEALDPSAWESSEWISACDAKVATDADREVERAAGGTAALRTVIANAKRVKRVRWMTTGLGVYDLFVNGKRVGNDFLKPGFTHVRKTRRAFTYDVTGLVDCGIGAGNSFGVEVGAGWWRDQVVGYVGRKSAFRGVLEFAYDDGSVELKGTRAAEWEGASDGPVRHSGIFDGEEYDARIRSRARLTAEEPLHPGGCERNDEFRGRILPTDGAEVLLREDLAMSHGPMSLKAGETKVVDFGQNCAAVPRFRFRAKRGTVLTVLPGEMVNDADRGSRGSDGPKGSVYRANLRSGWCCMRMIYTFAGEGVEEYLPRFTYFGYRYLSLSATGDVEVERLDSVPVSSISGEMETGTLKTGHPRLNRFIENVRWGQLSNYLSVPTDCPQRNERQGWMADTQVFAEAGAYMADTYDFMRKFLWDVRDMQYPSGCYAGVSPSGTFGGYGVERFGWSDAGVIIPYRIWQQFGRTGVLSEHWESMERFMNWLEDNRYAKGRALEYQWGDWLSYEPYESCSGRGWKVDANGKRVLRPETARYWKYMGGCYWLMDARMMSRMAAALGKSESERRYTKMAEEALDYLRRECLEEGRLPAFLQGMQTPALFALHLGLLGAEVAAETKAALLRNIRAHGDCLQTGFLGTSVLMDTLVEIGAGDVACTLLLQTRDPSWLYSVDQGATTVWERWNSYTVEKGFGPADMNSFNHYAYGQVLGWMFRHLAGIAPDPAAPGYRNVIMRPLPDRRVGSVTAEYRSAAGLVRSAWRYEGDRWLWDFSVPEGATASVFLPGETAAVRYGTGRHHVEQNAKTKLKHQPQETHL